MGKRSGVAAIIVILLLTASCSQAMQPSDAPNTQTQTQTDTPVSAPGSSATLPSASPPGSPEPDSPGPAPAMPGNAELADLWGRIDGSTATIPLTAAIYDAVTGGGGSPPTHYTTPDAYYRLITNADTDLIFVTYPSEDEFEMARQNGVELEIVPIVKDALVFLVNTENPIDDVPLSRLRDIYAGKVESWSELGGASESIIPYQRTPDSGSQTLFLKLLMEGLEPSTPPTEWIVESMGSLVESVSNYDNSKNAIGYSMFYYVNNMYGNSRFKLLSIDGVAPARATIERGQYALEDYYYAVIRGNTPEDSPARRLIGWLLTDDGQLLAASAGYIPLRPLDGAMPENAVDPIYLGDTEHSSGTGGTALKDESDLGGIVVNGVRKPLSDIFYDGFNYIEYVNAAILESLNYIDLESYKKITEEERRLMRPFTGVPNDYPNYEVIGMGTLIINFPKGNPFFNEPWGARISLTEDISPYGTGLPAYSVIYDYSRRLMPGVDLYSIRVSIPDRPDIASKINEQLESWTDALPGDGESVELLNAFVDRYLPGEPTGEGYAYKLQPVHGLWGGKLLSVSYILQTYDGPAIMCPMVFTVCFDIDTGGTANLAEAVAGSVDYARANLFLPERYGDGDYPLIEPLPEGYLPSPGSIVTDAWIIDERLSLYVTEPDGRVLQVEKWG